MPIPDPEDLVTKLDKLVEPAVEPENAILTDDARIVRWAGPLFALFSVILLPWTAYIAASLPARQLSPHYDVAWAGFDVLLCGALASTAYFALRRSRYLSTAATATATLLVVDAWFDVMTTPSRAATRVDLALCLRRAAAGGGLHLAQLSHPAACRAPDRAVAAPPRAWRPELTPNTAAGMFTFRSRATIQS